jgi:hypothetical protein
MATCLGDRVRVEFRLEVEVGVGVEVVVEVGGADPVLAFSYLRVITSSLIVSVGQ